MGYSLGELEDVQAQWKLRFPPDLVDLLRQHRPLLAGPASFDWLLSDPAGIQDRLDWPFDGFWFDVEHANVWWPEWGDKPANLAERRNRLEEIFVGAPKLIPLFGHRYIPQEPFERGNPIFSVHQTDVICYGSDLHDWVRRERGGWSATAWPPVKEIRLWSEALRKNNAAVPVI